MGRDVPDCGLLVGTGPRADAASRERSKAASVSQVEIVPGRAGRSASTSRDALLLARTNAHRLAALIAGTTLLTASSAWAQAQPTLKDRLDGAVSTVTGSPMADLDLDMKHVLDAMKTLDPKPIPKLSPEEARKQPSAADGVKAYLKEQGKSPAPEAGVTTKDMAYDTPAGQRKVRIYTPDGAAGPLPVVVYYHGGGFVIANLDTYDATPRAIAKGANAVVVSVEYRHAPEAKFPAQQEDAFAAYKWALANAKTFGGDPSKIALLGESAGGNLVTNVAVMARDQNVEKPVQVVAVYPMAGTNLDTPSYKDNTSTKPLNRDMMAWFYDQSVRTTPTVPTHASTSSARPTSKACRRSRW